jgi:hypothetical protein
VSAVIAAASLAVVSLLPTAAQASNTAGTPTQVYNFGNNLCLDDGGFATAPGSRVIIWGCNGYLNQKWVETVYSSCPLSIPGYGACASIQNKYSNLCLDVQGSSTTNGALAIQWPCNIKDAAQMFTISPSGQGIRIFFIRAIIGTCLDDPYNTSNWGTQVWFWQCNTSIAQTWGAATFGGT